MQEIINGINSLKDNHFDYIYKAAKLTKCNIFYVEGNHLFGAPLEPYKVNVVDLPFSIKGSIIFEISNSSTNIDLLGLGNFEYFQAGPDLRYAFIPIEYYEDYCNGIIRLLYNEIDKTNMIFNIGTSSFITGVVPSISSELIMNKLGIYLNQIFNTRNLVNLRMPAINNQYYYNIETDPQIQEVFASKVSNGTFTVSFGEDRNRKIITIFKGFLNVVKADSIDLEIINDYPGSFIAIFYIKHKKNSFSKDPLGNIIGDRIYCRYLDI